MQNKRVSWAFEPSGFMPVAGQSEGAPRPGNGRGGVTGFGHFQAFVSHLARGVSCEGDVRKKKLCTLLLAFLAIMPLRAQGPPGAQDQAAQHSRLAQQYLNERRPD